MPTSAHSALAAAARAALQPLGFERKGRSRTWLADRGWWLLIIDFQPSSWQSDLAYLNLGEQHLWVERDHFVFEEPERPLGGAHTVDLASTAEVGGLVEAAELHGARRLAGHEEGEAALRGITGRSHDDLNAGIAVALLGQQRVAVAKLTGQVHPAHSDTARRYLESLEDNSAEQLAAETIARTRRALKLPPTTATWRTSPIGVRAV